MPNAPIREEAGHHAGRRAFPSTLARPAEGVALGLLLLAALWPRVWNLDAYTGSFDEGIRTQQLLLMSAGYRPFKDIFSSQGPLLLDVLYPFYVLFGQTLEAARVGVVACSMVALGGVWWVGRRAAGPIAGLASVALLAFSPTFLEGSRLALAEVPTIAPALLAVGAAYAYAGAGDRRWLILSAVLCAVALLIKPMVLHVGAPLLALLAVAGGGVSVGDRGSRIGGRGLRGAAGWRVDARRALRDLALYAVVVAALCGTVVVALGPAQVWDNLGAYRAGAGRGLGAEWAANLRLTANVLARERLGLFALAAVGLALGLWRRPARTVPIALWALTVVGLFALYGDLADKHIVYLVPPLALLGGIGVELTAAAVRGAIQGDGKRGGDTRGGVRAGRWKVGAALGGLAALGIYAWNVPPLYRANRYVVVDAEAVAEQRRDLAAELDLAEVMRTRAEAGDWVLSDNPNAAFRARRLVIPALVDTSGTRVDAGSLTDARAIEAVAEYRPAVIVTWARRLGRLDAFARWLTEQGGYRLDRAYDGGWRLYVRSEQVSRRQ